MNTVQIVRASDSSWSEWLEGAVHDFYHTAAYHAFSEEQGEGAAYLALYGNRDRFAAWPYLLRDDCECRDIGSVYGYSGPVWRGCQPGDTFLAEAMREIHDAWKQQGAVSAFARLHPLLENHLWIGDTGSLSGHGHTVAIDLTLSPDEVLRNYNRKLRQELRYARVGGVETFIDTEWRHFDDFMRLYHHTMDRNGAESLYFFSDHYFRRLKHALGHHAVLMIATVGQKVIAACIFVEYGDYVQAHLEGADEEYLSVSPFKLMVDDERVRGQAAGRKLLHLGGGRGGREDTLFTVKRRFSPLQRPFFTFRKVLDQKLYDGLLQQRRLASEEAGQEFAPGGFFPAYRMPMKQKSVLAGGAQ
jgi:hypothetical protein